MIAFYAFGGGHGHLTRVQAFIHTMNINDPYLVFTSNPGVFRLFKRDQVVLLENVAAAKCLSKALSCELRKHGVVTCYLDTFPFGILSELEIDFFEGITVHLISRRIKWNAYQIPERSAIHFDTAYWCEEPEPEQLDFIKRHSNQQKSIELKYPSPTLSQHTLLDSSSLIWLIVHTTHIEEVQLLIDHAKDLAWIEKVNPKFLLISDQSPDEPDDQVIHLKAENPINWYDRADKIFTGAGFNTINQLKAHRDKHVGIAFDRRFDDQNWRLKCLHEGRY